MTKVRVENPAPAALMVLNGKRRKNMARSRKAKSTRRATTVRRKTSTPKRHASRAIARRSNPAPRRAMHRRTVAKSHRRVRRHTRRVGNPFRGSLLAKGIALATGAAFVQLTLGFVPPIGGVSPIADAARTAGVGWLLSLGMQRIGFLRPYADDVALAGFTLAGGKLISSFILPFANRLFGGQQAQPAMAEAAPVTNQVSGIATMYPGLNPYSAYDSNGMGGIAVIDPSINPYGEYAY